MASNSPTTKLFTNDSLNLIISGIASIHNISLILYHIYKSFASNKKTGKQWHKTHVLSIFSMSVITLFSVSVVWLYIINYLHITTFDIDCNLSMSIGLMVYICSKYALYILLLERLFIIFANSEYKFSNYFKLTTRISIAILLIISTISVIITETGKENENGICLNNTPLFLWGIFSLIDIFISIFVLILFSRKLYLLSGNTIHAEESVTSRSRTRTLSIGNMKESERNKYIQRMNKQLLIVMRKANLLGVIAVFGTQLSVVISIVFRGNLWTLIDSMVNMWCVLLMFQSYNHIFDNLCKYALRIFSDECLTFLACYCCECCIPTHLRPETDNGNLGAISVSDLKTNEPNTLNVETVAEDMDNTECITPDVSPQPNPMQVVTSISLDSTTKEIAVEMNMEVKNEKQCHNNQNSTHL
eukprot:345191_1